MNSTKLEKSEVLEQVLNKQSRVRELLKKVEPTDSLERPEEIAWNKGWNQFNKPRGG